MLTPNRLTGCALATLLIGGVAPASAQAQEAAPSSPRSGVASFSGASSKPAAASDAPPAAPGPGAEAAAPAEPTPSDAPSGESAPAAPAPGAVRTYAAPTREAGDPVAGSTRSASLYATSARVRISIPHYTFEQVSRSILRLHMAVYKRSSVPTLSASPPPADQPSPALEGDAPTSDVETLAPISIGTAQ